MAVLCNGGYAILDFEDYNFTSGTAATRAGMTAKLAAVQATEKPVVIYNLRVGTQHIKPVVTMFANGYAYFILPGATMRKVTVNIAASDSVTVTVANL